MVLWLRAEGRRTHGGRSRGRPRPSEARRRGTDAPWCATLPTPWGSPRALGRTRNWTLGSDPSRYSRGSSCTPRDSSLEGHPDVRPGVPTTREGWWASLSHSPRNPTECEPELPARQLPVHPHGASHGARVLECRVRGPLGAVEAAHVYLSDGPEVPFEPRGRRGPTLRHP